MKLFIFLTVLFALLHYSCKTVPKGVKPIAPFDINRYAGTWYEIARKNHKFEKGLSKVTATYIINQNGSVTVINEGYNVFTGKRKKIKGKAKLINDGKEGRLKVSFFGPFYSPYNIIAIDPDYNNAMVVGGSKDYLWILSRSREMPDEVKDRFLQIAKEADIKTDELIWVKQDEANSR